MSDVARAAGVSAATVSRALRGEPGVSEATRRYVTEIAKKMKYAIARDASSLAGGRRFAIAVLTGDVGRGDLLAGAEGALRQAGFDVLLYVLGDGESRAGFFEEMPLGRRVDGVLALSITLAESESAALATLDVPVVRVDDGDLRSALRMAVGHLIGLGHRDIALVLADGVDESYDEVLVAEGLAIRPEWTLWSSPTVVGGEQVADALLDGEHLPTAVISSDGEVALGVFMRLRRDGRAIPADVSLISLDDRDLARAVGITAIEGALREEGERAVAALLGSIRGDGGSSVHGLSARLVVRDSTGPVA
ncbi:LacI family DNA-binding transcriptional regulator [Umezawaea sp. Da 62-37]|uniref:LacI family DNA-binding transcriptional regulator n=1 Tax=Umezawaea sp. Da 62-37 TaxID=3075927 RepID=UPI0028F6D99B|nr:LacI family DNA-binding transcriptional regulator [Umezawaea sp. Da 62-37]WNV92074.1 LacI family DNA-binding transcriptional regulator [Umezawaea sp. Da 62-37]